MKIKTSELQGAALDWAVALALWGTVDIATFGPMFGKGFYGPCIKGRQTLFDPSTNWTQGGPIIERMFREGLEMRQGEPEAGNQRAWARLRDGRYYWHETSPLIAAMRCYVASKLGDEVEIPEELV